MLSDSLKKTIQSYFSQLLENKKLQSRYGQKLMIAEIANTLSSVETDEEGLRAGEEPAICVIEAGTGTGKTIAYMVSAIPMAQALGKKLVISTATVALQEQVMFKDLPDLLQHSDIKFSFTLAKGLGRYLCLSRLDNILKSSSSQDAMLDLYNLELEDSMQTDMELYQRMLDALSDQSWTGDRDDWPEALDAGVWRHVSVDHGQCSGSRCSNYSNCCFFKSRDNVQKVDCIVANHDLVLADLSLGGGVILPQPEDTIYIFDEAHHLPRKGVSHFSHFIRLRSTGNWLEQLHKALARFLAEFSADSSVTTLLRKISDITTEAIARLKQDYFVFEQFAEKAEAGNGKGRGEVSQYTFKNGKVDSGIREICEGLRPGFAELTQGLDKLLEIIKKAMEAEGSELDRQQAENWFPVFGSMLNRSEAAENLWLRFGAEDAPDEAPCARWITFSKVSAELEISLSCSPVIAASALESSLWNKCFAAILTSATLSALGTFDFLSLRIGLHDSTRFSRIASPFNYQEAAILRIPTKGFDPSDTDAHTQAIIKLLPEILDSDKGSLVLFSSRRQMQDVIDGMDDDFTKKIMSQDDFSKQQLISRHKKKVDAGDGSVIFGLASLTEGIDLPGDYCTHVVIAKIPFSVPNDPVEATLAQWIQSKGKNPFTEISVPQAAMGLIQASGRLLRTETDSGVITILDERLLTRNYGQAILDSLPPYRREHF